MPIWWHNTQEPPTVIHASQLNEMIDNIMASHRSELINNMFDSRPLRYIGSGLAPTIVAGPQQPEVSDRIKRLGTKPKWYVK